MHGSIEVADRSMRGSTVSESCSNLLLVEEMTHRVMNDYSIAVAILNEAATYCSDAGAKSLLAIASRRFRTLAATHRSLLAPPSGEELDVGLYIGRICSSLCESILAERKIRLLFQPCAAALSSEQCWRLGLILAELIRNAAR